MEPIPLRSLTVLLNRERMLSDHRFTDVGLMKSSFSDPLWAEGVKAKNLKQFKTQTKSVEMTNMHIFHKLPTPAEISKDIAPTTCLIHPDAGREVQTMSAAQLELIFHESRGHNGCFKAIGLYQLFFDLCPPKQQISIQIANEAPVLVDARSGIRFRFQIRGPKLTTITSINQPQLIMDNGLKDDEDHVILGFEHPHKRNEYLVVDMARMQYGAAGRGNYGETFFLGTFSDWEKSMERICEQPIYLGKAPLPMEMGEDKVNEARLKACANRAWQRWQNREISAWCDFCGKGGPGLKQCDGCKTVKIHYCSAEHRVNGWKLHQHTCEKVRA